MAEVVAAKAWTSNAELILDVHRLGYLRNSWLTCDTTYGNGTFWKLWQPETLVAHDIKLDGVDFRRLPHDDEAFDVVVFDPPYKLNGRPDPKADERYGVDVPTRWQDRMQLILDGAAECARVVRRKGYLLVKCQDQVCSGAIRWQTDEVRDALLPLGMNKVDRFHLLGGRPQPEGRQQVHARSNFSTLLVFQKVKDGTN